MVQKITEWSIEAADGSWYTAWSVRGRSALQYYRGWEVRSLTELNPNLTSPQPVNVSQC